MGIETHKKFLAQLKRHEGSKKDGQGHHVAYRDTMGKLTIGYGHNLDAVPLDNLRDNAFISEARATEILISDVASAAKALDERIPWWRRLDEPRQAVLLNMAFNLGASGLMKFERTLQAVREMRWRDAYSGMLASRWAGQVGRRAVELAEQMATGEWQRGV